MSQVRIAGEETRLAFLESVALPKKREVIAMRATFMVLVAICGVVVTLVLAPAGTAGQPVTQPLNPEPPSVYTCKTVGEGFICEASLLEPYGPYDNGIVCGSGSGTFDIFDQGLETLNAIRYYDANGDLVKRVIHDAEVGALSNPLTGASIPYTINNVNTDVYVVPGDPGSVTETTTGNQNLTVPGMGNVWKEAGRLFFADAALTDLEFEAGHHAAIDYYYNGDTSVADQLCTALGA